MQWMMVDEISIIDGLVLNFSLLTPSHLLKVTKFLVKIYGREKHFCL